MVYFSHPQAHKLAEELKEKGVWVLALSSDTIRAVFHLGITEENTHAAVNIVKDTLATSF